jgi:SAM-dependent methyltransferase
MTVVLFMLALERKTAVVAPAAMIKSAAVATAGLVARNPWGWKLVFKVWPLRRGSAVHPIDLFYRVETSRELPPYLIAPHRRIDGEVSPYAGCHPNCVRAAIEALPGIRSTTFYDLGCGRGRTLVIASEYPFHRIVGIDLSAELCSNARANAARIAQQHPDRTAIEVTQGDAAESTLPDGPLVVFIYHSFGPVTLARVLDRLTAAAAPGQQTTRDITVIYENPVYGQLIDTSSRFHRFYGARIPCEADERPHHPDPDDSVVIWRSGPTEANPNPEFDIVVVTPDRRAVVVPRPKPGS